MRGYISIMESKYSLVSILRNDPDFAEALSRKKAAVKKDKQSLVNAAETYVKKYEQEVIDGTRRKAKLLSEGESNGLTEEEVMKDFGKFLPTVQTPILNLLYFLLRESEEIDRDLYKLRDDYNVKYGGLEDRESEVLSENLDEPPPMFEYLYANMTLETFNKLKKLKALSKSPNEEEAFLAYRKCLALCKKYNLDFDKIPCNVG